MPDCELTWLGKEKAKLNFDTTTNRYIMVSRWYDITGVLKGIAYVRLRVILVWEENTRITPKCKY